MKRRVFISHSSSNSAIADLLCKSIEDRGIPCWIAPRDILPGSEWAAAIVSGIEECDILLLVLSSASASSKQVIREIECAADKKKILMPVRLEEIQLEGALKYFLGVCHWCDATEPPLEARFQELAAQVEATLRSENPVAHHAPPAPRHLKPPTRRSKYLAPTLLGAVLVAAAAWYAFATSKSSTPPLVIASSAVTVPTAAPSVPPADVRQVAPMEQPAIPASLPVARDVAAAPAEKNEWPVKLTEISYNPDALYVIIVDTRTGAGDVFSIGEYVFGEGRLRAIERDHVVIERDGVKRRLYLEGADRAASLPDGAPAKPPADPLRLTELNYNPDSPYVIIEDTRNGARDIFSIGEYVFGEGRLRAIERDHVVIERDGVKRQLHLTID